MDDEVFVCRFEVRRTGGDERRLFYDRSAVTAGGSGISPSVLCHILPHMRSHDSEIISSSAASSSSFYSLGPRGLGVDGGRF
jgi:hypothetical protein